MIGVGIDGNNPGRILKSVSPFLGEIREMKRESPPPHSGTRYSYAVERPRGRKIFETIEYGYRAMFLILRSYQTLHGLCRLDSMIRRWSLGRGVRQSDYVRAVARRLNLRHDSCIDTRDEEMMVSLVASMVRVELGVLEDREVLRRAWGMLGLSGTTQPDPASPSKTQPDPEPPKKTLHSPK